MEETAQPGPTVELHEALAELTRLCQRTLRPGGDARPRQAAMEGLRTILRLTTARAAFLYSWDAEVQEYLPLAEEKSDGSGDWGQGGTEEFRRPVRHLIERTHKHGKLVEIPDLGDVEGLEGLTQYGPSALVVPLRFEARIVGFCGLLLPSLKRVKGQLPLLHFVAFSLLADARHLQRAEEMTRQNRELARANKRLELMVEELESRQRMIEAFSHELRSANEQLTLYSRCLEEAKDGIFITDRGGRVVYVNRAFVLQNGYSQDEVLGREFTFLVSAPAASADDFMSRLGDTGLWRGESAVRRRGGEEYLADVTVTAVRDESGEAIAHIGILRDVTERKHYESQLVRLANHDPLTGLYNRRRFQEELEHQLAEARRHGVHGALLWLDLDQFKEVNDSLGHGAGDELLVTLTQALREQLRETDTLARLGGDEFALLLPHSDSLEAESVADRILKEIRGHVAVVANQPVRVTTSIGIALFPQHGTTSQELLARADLAMYQAKEEGRNRYSVYRLEEDQQAQLASRVVWTRRIREALEQNRFLLHGQPILDLRSAEIAGGELLLRMADSSREPILPGAFLDVAERFGMIRDIDRWVVRQAVKMLDQNRGRYSDTWMSINLSSKAVGDRELPRLIERELRRTQIDPSRLVIEITETAAIADVHRARRFVDTLKALGCRFALDDFGVGFTSFFHLKHLDVDYLKIDGSFIRNLPRDPTDQRLVRAMVEVARGLGKGTIAEFVEDEATLDLLRELEVDFAQGYHIGHPQCLEAWGSEAHTATGLV